MKTFENFIEENYKGFNFISISNEAIVPGVIINSDDRIVDSVTRLFPKVNPTKWALKTVKANMLNQTITGERELEIGLTFLGLFTLKGGNSSKYEVKFEFNDVTKIIFDTQNGGAYENEIRQYIMDLKNSDRSTWKEILHEQLVMEVIIVKSAIVEFKKNGTITSEIERKEIQNDVSFNGNYSWDSTGKMTITNNSNIPFGVIDFQIKRFM